MWELIQIMKDDSDVILSAVLMEPCSLTIGRVGCDLNVPDLSISRKHATLQVFKSKDGNLEFHLIDHSKFGTLINNRTLTNRQQQLFAGDRFALGTQNQVEFRLTQSPLRVAVSSVDRTTKERIKNITNLLYGELVAVCDANCSLLVMSYLVVTAKVVCALLASVPIVTPHYMESLLSAASNVPFIRPDPKSFLPPLKEERLTPEDSSCFLPVDTRASLFSQKIFYVLTTNQFVALAPIVQLGMGKVVLWDCESTFLSYCKQHFCDSLDPSFQMHTALQNVLRQKEACVIHTQQLTGDARDWHRTVYSALRTVRRRPILESEIGFAVVYNSTSGYCNPETKCPRKLYEEAGISQAHSINPFHLDSRLDDKVFKEHPANAPSIATFPAKRPKCPWTQSSESHLSRKEFDMKTAPRFTKIVSPVARNPLSYQSHLVPDSEKPQLSPSPLHPAHLPTSTVPAPFSSDAAASVTLASPRHLAGSPTSTPSSPFRVLPLPRFRQTDSRLNPALSANSVQPFPDDADPLSVLNNMPHLIKSTNAGSVNIDSPTNSISTLNKPLTVRTSRSTVSVMNPALPPVDPCGDMSKLNAPISPDASQHGDTPPDYIGRSSPPYRPTTDWLKTVAGAEYRTTNEPSDTLSHSLPDVCPPIEYVKLVTRNATNLRRTSDRNNSCNYKPFRKVWPVHYGHTSESASCKRIQFDKVVHLTAFQPQTYCPTSESIGSSDIERGSLNRERELVNKIFEQMCEMPRVHL